MLSKAFDKSLEQSLQSLYYHDFSSLLSVLIEVFRTVIWSVCRDEIVAKV